MDGGDFIKWASRTISDRATLRSRSDTRRANLTKSPPSPLSKRQQSDKETMWESIWRSRIPFHRSIGKLWLSVRSYRCTGMVLKDALPCMFSIPLSHRLCLSWNIPRQPILVFSGSYDHQWSSPGSGVTRIDGHVWWKIALYLSLLHQTHVKLSKSPVEFSL